MAPPEGDAYADAARLHRAGRLQEAEALYRQCLAASPAHADCLHQLGALLVQAKGVAAVTEALAFCQAAIQLAPSNARYRRSLGVVHEAAGSHEAAAEAYARAVEKRPEARTYIDLARALKAAGRLGRAAEAYRGALRLQPDHPSAAYKLGSLLRQLGRREAAAEAFRQHLRIAPGHTCATFWLAALTDAQPDACPADMVATMFDSYAERFDEHLTQQLAYATPQKLMDCILQAQAQVQRDAAAAHSCAPAAREPASGGSSDAGGSGSGSGRQRAWAYAVDLGCGTGLMGPQLRGRCKYLAGVDLSPGMVKKAEARGCYDALAVGEVTAYLRSLAASAKRHGPAAGAPRPGTKQAGACVDLLTAADVLVYLGDLQPLLAAAAAVAAEGALFAFSTELLAPPASCSSGSSSSIDSADGAASAPGAEQGQGQRDFQLLLTGRYAHSPAFIARLAAATGWRPLLVHETEIRQNAGQPIIGNLCVLQRAGGQQASR